MQSQRSHSPVTTPAVVIVGGGTMGADIALVCARGGCRTFIVEIDPARMQALPSRVKRGMEELGFGQRAELVSCHQSLEDVEWSLVDAVIECVFENLGDKQELFAKLVRIARPDTVLASNSSSFPISRIAEGLPSADRMLGLHFFMPAHLVPGVEVVRGEATAPNHAAWLSSLMTRCGMVPVDVKKDLPGFLANRMQHALAREAFALIDAGIATPEDVDKAVRFGFGFRFLAAGPALQRDHAGLEIHEAAAAAMYPSLARVDAPARCLSEHVARGELGMKTGQGFYAWDQGSIAAERMRYDGLLKAGLQLLKDELPKIER